MKKTVRKMLILLLCVLMIFSFAACGKDTPGGETSSGEKPFEPTDAISLWNKLDEVMSGLTSFESNMNMQVTYYYLGNRFESTGVGYGIFTADSDYNETDITVVCTELEYEENRKSVRAYYQGKMYLAETDGTYDQKFCSEMTIQEYDATGEGAMSEEVDFKDCTKSEFSKDEAGNWNLKFSGYTQNSIHNMLEYMAFSEENLGSDILDMEVKVFANADFYVQKMEIGFTFANEDDISTLPKLSFVMEYSNHNTAVFDTAKLNTEEYTVVDDVRILDDVYNGIVDIQETIAGEIKLEIKTVIRSLDQKYTSKESDKIVFGKKNGHYFYEIDGNVDGEELEIDYKNGVQTFIGYGTDSTSSQSEEEAKMWINSLINHAQFDKMQVSSLEVQEDGTYLFKIDKVDVDTYNASMEGTGYKFTSGTREIEVAMADGAIAKIYCKTALKGKISYGGSSESVTTTVESTMTVVKLENSGVAV